MSQIRSFDEALDFYPEAKAKLGARFGGFGQVVGAFFAAISEGHAAASRYHQLTSRGVPHDKAASKVFAEHFA